MSILTKLLHGEITFSEAISEAAGWAQGVVASDPVFTQAAGDALSAIKQAASDAVTIADSALVPHLAPAADAVEAALETALAGATGGLSVPFNPLIDAGIDRIAGIAKNAADAWALQTKARLAAPAASVAKAK